MREEYLHYLWKLQRFSASSMKTVDHKSLKVLDPGWLNPNAGPDFFNGQIELDGITWSGNIEIHLKSSDWYKHHHHHDQAYDNVILHVVLDYDQPVLIADNELPTLELRELIDPKHFETYVDLLEFKRFIPCQHSFSPNPEVLRYQLGASLFHRLERLTHQLEMDLIRSKIQDRLHVYLLSLAGAFGMRTNKLPFQELAKRIPLSVVLKERWNPIMIHALVFGIAGLLESNYEDEYPKQLRQAWKLLQSKHGLESMKNVSWKFGGVRPYNFPTIRLSQFANFLAYWQLNDPANLSSDQIIRDLERICFLPMPSYWNNHFVFDKLANHRNSSSSQKLIDSLLINGVVPYLFFLRSYYSDYPAGDKAEELLHQISPECNGIIRDWKALGVRPKSAADTQALIELKNQFCDQQRCLNCAFGHLIMEKDKLNDYHAYYV
jgi:hypothetical protein